jgi:hypothetical protein
MMNKWLHGIGLGGFVVFGAVACSSTAADKYPSSDSFCDAKAQEECQVAARCAATDGNCLAARKSECSKLVSQSAGGTHQYRPGQAEGCVNKTHDVYSRQTPLTPDVQGELAVACAKIFQGTTKSFQTCESTLDCEGDLICDKTFCAAKVTKNGGEPCGNPGEVCNTGNFCDTFSGGVAQCKPRKAKGEACDTTKNPCNESLRCNTSCEERFGSGSSCGSNGDCAPSAPYCDPFNGNKCDAGLIFAPGAGACKAYGG